MRHAVVAVAFALSFGWSPAHAVKVDCEPARCATQSAVAAECPCEGQANHGQYVSCVAHVVRRLASDGTIPINCKGKVTRCAAKSTCGKPGFVTCLIPTDTCDLTTGFCIDDPTIACTTDLDCGAKCKIKSTADGCVARSGVVGTSTTCCASCGD